MFVRVPGDLCATLRVQLYANFARIRFGNMINELFHKAKMLRGTQTGKCHEKSS
jgi:hypothetical protein